MCEEAISCAIEGLLGENEELRQQAIVLENDIDLKEREIENYCVHLLLRDQPVAGDLRRITAAQKMITDMERIGDQAADIAELSVFMKGSSVKSDVHIGDMAREVIKMLTDSIDAFVGNDADKANAVIQYDDIVDALFTTVKGELIERIAADPSTGEACLDLLQIAKYLERIGDHATNIAECVVYALPGAGGASK
jgi:phosphate transport system protein